MINIISTNEEVKNLLSKSLERSHGKLTTAIEDIYCFISPTAKDESLIKELILKKTKILIYGSITATIAKIIGLKHNQNIICVDDIVFDHDKPEDLSNLKVVYTSDKLAQKAILKKRFFHRFDFTDEWNNLGYGKITTDGTVWSLSNSLDLVDATLIAEIIDERKESKSIFSVVKDFKTSSILYINREAGLVDGLDISLVETFLDVYRNDELPSLPLLLDLPKDVQSIVSPRLDCDQSIINTQPLVELYKSNNINLSLAIATGINISEEEVSYLNNYYNNGGSLLSHTINHYFDWGDCYDAVFQEAKGSKEWLENHVENLDALEYAVSPFHTNKPYSIEALADAGYKGFISGIIHNDPEYLLGTSGQVPFTKQNIVSHSQQCMLHGDCYHRHDNNLDIYKHSFEMHYKAKKMFGYLDHPFGDYDYGWANEEERLAVHKEFIEYINGFTGVKWMTSVEVLKFVYDKSQVIITIDKNDELILQRESHESKEKIVVEYKGRFYVC